MYRTHSNLLETLLHELIHAYLFLTKPKYARNDGVDGHGPAFIRKMTEINDITSLHLSVYHSFSDEVRNCQEHVWICDGKCGYRPPYFGIIRRARNCPPGKNDWWFEKHN
jgi:predicted SprT family Zn-dependent metalloprotease